MLRQFPTTLSSLVGSRQGLQTPWMYFARTKVLFSALSAQFLASMLAPFDVGGLFLAHATLAT
jgi:hypothetical protein